jgi:hypothetical protein
LDNGVGSPRPSKLGSGVLTKTRRKGAEYVDYRLRFPFALPANCDAGSADREVIERRLEHENGEARKFYAGLATAARVGMEATGYAQWFERMIAEQGHQLWVGDAAEIRAAMVRLRC